MAFQLGGPKGRNSRYTPGSMAEINVTPLVDVMLVLLIIFMVSAPLMQHGMQVDLPKTSATSSNEAPKKINLIIESESKIYLDSDAVRISDIKERLSVIAKKNPDTQVNLQGNRKVPYGLIAEVLAEVKNANINNIRIATEPKK